MLTGNDSEWYAIYRLWKRTTIMVFPISASVGSSIWWWLCQLCHCEQRNCPSGGLDWKYLEIDGSVQGGSNASALAMELLQSCTKPTECLCNHLNIDTAFYKLLYMLGYVWISGIITCLNWKTLTQIKNDCNHNYRGHYGSEFMP